ncbi:MAG: AAA family ATPase, partial [Candidatus Aenigmatarchaeota archaeon]
MAYIQRLVLQGFKSFNKKIAIPFSQTFSVVCGPNGSGKSNINDAVCFVLGRTSAKSMRADRLHELIFHGGQYKAPAELASVGLYLDNSNKEFPIEESTLHIERRVNKTGVSVYRINGKIVTRQEVLDVLSAARIFPDGYNIILQGDITNIIEMDSVERRVIIDEVSGIKEYDEKKEKSQKEFEKVEQKLKEVGLIIRERDEAFKKLKEEREVALKYISLNKELKKLRASIAHKRFSSSQTIFQSLTSEIEIKEKQIADFSAALDALDTEIEKKEKELEQLLKFVFERSKKVQIVREVEELRAKILRTRDKIEYDIRERNRLEMIVAKLESIGESQLSRPVAEITKLNNPNVFGTIISLCKVEDKYQTAVEACGGNHLNDIVVKDVRTAEACINHLKENKIGRATFLPLDKMEESLRLPSLTHSELSKSIGWASDLIDYDKRYDAAFKFVFGSTLIFDKIESARHLIGKVRIATLDGDLIERSGAMIGGYFRRKKAFEFSEMDEYKSAIKALENEISTLKKQIDEYDKELEKKVEQERREALDIVDSEKARSRLMKEIEDSKRKRKKAYEDRLDVQSHINKFKLQRARTEAEVENSSQDFEQYKEERDFLDLPVEEMESRTKVVIRETESLGAVNMKSIEEFERFGE